VRPKRNLFCIEPVDCIPLIRDWRSTVQAETSTSSQIWLDDLTGPVCYPENESDDDEDDDEGAFGLPFYLPIASGAVFSRTQLFLFTSGFGLWLFDNSRPAAALLLNSGDGLEEQTDFIVEFYYHELRNASIPPLASVDLLAHGHLWPTEKPRLSCWCAALESLWRKDFNRSSGTFHPYARPTRFFANAQPHPLTFSNRLLQNCGSDILCLICSFLDVLDVLEWALAIPRIVKIIAPTFWQSRIVSLLHHHLRSLSLLRLLAPSNPRRVFSLSFCLLRLRDSLLLSLFEPVWTQKSA
jgi:hypothetical protein